MKRWRVIPAYVFVGLSLLHTVVAFVQFKTLTEQALWFASAGMALFFCGAINLILHFNQDNSQIKRLAIISNLIMTIFVIAFGAYTMKRNLVNPLAWILILNAVAALMISVQKTSRI